MAAALQRSDQRLARRSDHRCQPVDQRALLPVGRDHRGQVMQLHHVSATEAKELFAKRELSPVELLDAVVQRTVRVNPAVNAFSEQMLEDAYESAREAERRY